MSNPVVLAGRYQLERKIGQGGMGDVWRARDLSLGRAVAVKLLPARLPYGHQRTMRFRREANLSAQLQHSGITTVFDQGVHDGRPFMVMELLDGRDLQQVLGDSPHGLAFDLALDIAVQLTRALEHAHGRGIVHRDIKPANIMLLGDNQIKIGDFGIARSLQADSDLTLEGIPIGTPAYMAPEQCRGEQVDERTDLYAVGCVVFALFTGSPPFPARNDHQAVLRAHLDEAPPPMASRRSGVPRALESLVGRLLSKQRADRPAKAADVAVLLDAIRREHRPAGHLPQPRWGEEPSSPSG